MTSDQFAKLKEIRRLLSEAYQDYFKRSDGYCKSSEGATEVYYPNYFDNQETVTANGLGIYSYVLGPGRMHHWWKGDGPSNDVTKWTGDRDPFDVALEDVREWHAEQLATSYDEDV